MLFSDCMNSETSYIFILPQHDSSSWTDLTFLLKPAISPGHFLPSRHYFQQQRRGAPAPVVSVAAEGSLYKTLTCRQSRASNAHAKAGDGHSVQRAGRGPEAKQPQEGTSHPPLSVSPDAKLCTTGSPATGSVAGHFSQSCYFDTRVVIPGEDTILGVTA